MSDTDLTPSPDEVPAIDVDEETSTSGSDAAITDFGEEPDVETRSDEDAPIDPSI
jgi:hypothetical protein